MKEKTALSKLMVLNMTDKDILDILGLDDRTITLNADDEYLQIVLEKKKGNPE